MYKILLVFAISFFGISLTGFSQSGAVAIKIDSLEAGLKGATSVHQVAIMVQIIDLSAQFAPNIAFVRSQQVLAFGDETADYSMKFKAASFLSLYYEKKGAFDSALYYANITERLLHKSINQQTNRNKLTIQEKVANQVNSVQSVAGAVSTAMILLLISVASFLVAAILLFWLRKQKKQFQNENLKRHAEIDALKQQIHENESHAESEIDKRIGGLLVQFTQSKAKGLEMKKALKKAEDANYLKNAFLGIISHQIRTPLNGIIGFSSLLETELSMLENKTLYEYAEGIEQSGDRLLNLLTNIIDISKLEANDIDLELHAFKIDDIINNIFELYVFSANEKGLAFKSKLSEIPNIIADEAKIMRVIHIIVDNAIKYTKNGFVNITTGFVPDTNEVLIRVKDTGVGMEASYQAHLFEAFRQESSGISRSYQGAGLGLPLAKRLLDLMHGRIEINSMYQVGTTVDIYLPCEKTVLRTQHAGKAADTDGLLVSKLDVFIVEDDRMNRIVLQKILQKTFRVTIAVDGDETLKIIEDHYKKGQSFQVMLFDINLPSPWDGIKLMQKIRSDYQEYRYIPFIAQTAYAMAGDREKILEAGFDDYLAKPIDKNELMTIIKNQLEKFKGMKQ